MAEAMPGSITRRSVVAGPLAGVTALAACVPGSALAHDAEAAADPVHAAIAAHGRAYAAYAAQLAADGEDDLAMEPLCEAEREAANALAATVPATLAGAAAALAYVRLLHERDDYPLLDDFGCYVLIASAATALRRALDRGCVYA